VDSVTRQHCCPLPRVCYSCFVITRNEYALLVFLREDARRRQILDAIKAEFETTTSPTFCVRRIEVAEHLARVFGRVINNDLFADVARAALSIGWTAIKNGNRSLYRGVRRRGLTDEQALADSRANRRDRRWRSAASPDVTSSLAASPR
jgi:hypothetical protein